MCLEFSGGPGGFRGDGGPAKLLPTWTDCRHSPNWLAGPYRLHTPLMVAGSGRSCPVRQTATHMMSSTILEGEHLDRSGGIPNRFSLTAKVRRRSCPAVTGPFVLLPHDDPRLLADHRDDPADVSRRQPLGGPLGSGGPLPLSPLFDCHEFVA